MSDSVRPHRQQPTRLPRPWDSPGKNTGVGCHCLLQFVLNFIKYFFIHWWSCLPVLIYYYSEWYRISNIKLAYIPGRNSAWSWCILFFMLFFCLFVFHALWVCYFSTFICFQVVESSCTLSRSFQSPYPLHVSPGFLYIFISNNFYTFLLPIIRTSYSFSETACRLMEPILPTGSERQRRTSEEPRNLHFPSALSAVEVWKV